MEPDQDNHISEAMSEIAFWDMCAALRRADEHNAEHFFGLTSLTGLSQKKFDEMVSSLCHSQSPLMVHKIMEQLGTPQERGDLLVRISYFSQELELNTPAMLQTILNIYGWDEIENASTRAHKAAYFLNSEGELGAKKIPTLDFFGSLAALWSSNLLTQEVGGAGRDPGRNKVLKL